LVLAKHEGDFQAAAEISLEMGELLRAITGPVSDDVRAKQEAIACCLSASEGWRDAAAQLGGAFASGAGSAGLTAGKDK